MTVKRGTVATAPWSFRLDTPTLEKIQWLRDNLPVGLLGTGCPNKSDVIRYCVAATAGRWLKVANLNKAKSPKGKKSCERKS